MPARIAMIEITTSNSMSVNPNKRNWGDAGRAGCLEFVVFIKLLNHAHVAVLLPFGSDLIIFE
jgi:hypothetical protein